MAAVSMASSPVWRRAKVSKGARRSRGEDMSADGRRGLRARNRDLGFTGQLRVRFPAESRAAASASEFFATKRHENFRGFGSKPPRAYQRRMETPPLAWNFCAFSWPTTPSLGIGRPHARQ